jgi:hypothetical protein
MVFSLKRMRRHRAESYRRFSAEDEILTLLNEQDRGKEHSTGMFWVENPIKRVPGRLS